MPSAHVGHRWVKPDPRSLDSDCSVYSHTETKKCIVADGGLGAVCFGRHNFVFDDGSIVGEEPSVRITIESREDWFFNIIPVSIDQIVKVIRS